MAGKRKPTLRATSMTVAVDKIAENKAPAKRILNVRESPGIGEKRKAITTHQSQRKDMKTFTKKTSHPALREWVAKGFSPRITSCHINSYTFGKEIPGPHHP